MLKLLIVKTSSLGDVIHNLPIIADIRAHYPDIQVDWLVEESFADIPKLHPAVNQVITVAMRRWRKSLFRCETWQEIISVKKLISATQYDIIIDTQGLLKSGLMSRLAHGIKHGYNKGSIREPLASYFYDIKHEVSRLQHAVVRNRSLAASAFGFSMPSIKPDYGIIAPSTTPVNLNQSYIVSLHGTSRDSKLWPTEHWVGLGKALENQQLSLVLPWASDKELIRAQRIASTLNNAVVLPKCTIAELAFIISQAKAAVGVDTGLSHLSVALNIPTIALYTDTNPELTGLYAGAYAAAISLGNINQVSSVNEVMTALNTVLN